MIAAQHTERPDTDYKSILVIAMDYAFLGRPDSDEISRTELTVLNIKDSKTGNMFPIPVPQKGIDPAEYATRKTLEAIKWPGHRESTLRTDGEPDVQKVADHVATHRGPDTRTAPERTPVADSQSNGLIENAHKSVE